MDKEKAQVLMKDIHAYLKFQGIKDKDLIIVIKRDGGLVRIGAPTRGLCLEALAGIYALLFQNSTDKEADSLDAAVKSIFGGVKAGLIGSLIRAGIIDSASITVRRNKKEGECADNE